MPPRRHHEPERRRGHALLVAVRLRRQHVEVVQRQRAGDATERAGRVGADGDELVAVVADPHLAGAHPRQHLAGRERPPRDLVDRTADPARGRHARPDRPSARPSMGSTPMWPVASESASVSVASSSRCAESPTASATPASVAGSARSRRVATSGSSRWCRTSVDQHGGVRRPTARAVGRSSAPARRRASEWSPG